ncbi:MAG: hypothetical protein VM34scaffold347_44 [Phage 66_12]|nr:MAG: hypothetical protein VM34scaffold347_44 [Phage 66_12]
MKSNHVNFDCPERNARPACLLCRGNLFFCTVCGAFEGAVPDECPGVTMTEQQFNLVYEGKLNYRGGRWVEECCATRKPALQHEDYLAANRLDN